MYIKLYILLFKRKEDCTVIGLHFFFLLKYIIISVNNPITLFNKVVNKNMNNTAAVSIAQPKISLSSVGGLLLIPNFSIMSHIPIIMSKGINTYGNQLYTKKLPINNMWKKCHCFVH